MPLKPFAPNIGAEKKIYLLKPRGFCAGVVRAIDVVKIALDLYGPPVYVRKEIVHNKHVVDELREAGRHLRRRTGRSAGGRRARSSARTAFRRRFGSEAKERNLQVIDATCPLVTKVHLEAVQVRARRLHHRPDRPQGSRRSDRHAGRSARSQMILVESVEDVDALKIADPDARRLSTQTTLSLDETRDIVARLKERFPMIQGPQIAGHLLCHRKPADGGERRGAVLRSAAGGGLAEQFEFASGWWKWARITASASYLVNDWSDVNPAWLEGVTNVAVTAGASAPEHLVEELIAVAARTTASGNWKKWK